VPFLDANALESDPAGMELLKAVVAERPGSSATALTETQAFPQVTTRHHGLAVAVLHVGLRLFVFALLVLSIARSRRPTAA
jgi:hypothetical protein